LQLTRTMTDFQSFRVPLGQPIDWDRLEPAATPGGLTRKKAEKQLKKNCKELCELQHRLYAEHERSVLICLQGRDAAGKDGTIRKVFGAMNPQGCSVTSFKVPSREEAAHDFLWRCHRAAPGAGRVSIFNRSHYEDVLVVRVHQLVPEPVWKDRYELINEFERLLCHRGTTVLKFFLHIDREEQLSRFRKRIDNPGKNWKISDADYAERHFWNGYTEAIEDALSRCSTKYAPWFVIPSNHKWFRNLVISDLVVDAMRKMDMHFPQPTVDMSDIRAKYHAAESASKDKA